MNAPQSINIIGLSGVNHNICHNNMINASIYAIQYVPTGFQIYAGKIFFSSSFFFFHVPLLLLGIGDGCLVVPNIHRGTHIITGVGPQAAVPYKNIWLESLVVPCTVM